MPPAHNQPRPSPAETAAMFAALRIEPLPAPTAAGITTFLDVMRRKYANGGALFQQFRAGPNAQFDWFAQRKRLDEVDFLNWFLASETVQQALPELGTITRIEPPLPPLWRAGPAQTDLFRLSADLARLVYHGGAYSGTHFSADHALTLAVDFVRGFSGNRYEDFYCWYPDTAWSIWFDEIVADYSVITYDHAQRTLTILCLTDSD